jgi:hypothetical protein
MSQSGPAVVRARFWRPTREMLQDLQLLTTEGDFVAIGETNEELFLVASPLDAVATPCQHRAA